MCQVQSEQRGRWSREGWRGGCTGSWPRGHWQELQLLFCDQKTLEGFEQGSYRIWFVLLKDNWLPCGEQTVGKNKGKRELRKPLVQSRQGCQCLDREQRTGWEAFTFGMYFDGGTNHLLREDCLGHAVCVMPVRHPRGHIEMVVGYVSHQPADIVRTLILNEIM